MTQLIPPPSQESIDRINSMFDFYCQTSLPYANTAALSISEVAWIVNSKWRQLIPLRAINPSYFKNIDFVATVAQKWPITAIELASPDIQDNTDFVTQVCLTSNHAFQYASQRLKDDKDVATTILRRSGLVYQHLSHRLKHDIEVILIAMSTHPDVLSNVPPLFKDHLIELFSQSQSTDLPTFLLELHKKQLADSIKSAFFQEQSPLQTQPLKKV